MERDDDYVIDRVVPSEEPPLLCARCKRKVEVAEEIRIVSEEGEVETVCYDCFLKIEGLWREEV